jgi:hypothetical protein
LGTLKDWTIKFFNADDFDEFEVAPSTVHRRMIMKAVAKLQTPHSKLGWSGNEKKQNVFEPKKLSFVAGNTFELMLDELEVSMHFYSYFFSRKITETKNKNKTSKPNKIKKNK